MWGFLVVSGEKNDSKIPIMKKRKKQKQKQKNRAEPKRNRDGNLYQKRKTYV